MDNTKKYIIDAVEISSSRITSGDEDITSLIQDIDIYEHLDLPYLTANITFVDSLRALERYHFRGGEFITIRLKPHSEADDNIVEKRFAVRSLRHQVKVNEEAEAGVIELIEDIAFVSSFTNVNKAYNGNPLDIMSKISEDFLEKPISTNDIKIFQKNLRLIVPNMRPLDALRWINNRISTDKGATPFLFSTLSTKSLMMYDLETLIKADPINTNKPFVYGAIPRLIEEEGSQTHLPILDYNAGSRAHVYDLMKNGHIGAEYQFYDAFTAKVYKHKFNYGNDIFPILSEKADLPATMSGSIEINEKNVMEVPSRRITRVNASGVYNEGFRKSNSLHEDDKVSDYSLKVKRDAMRDHFLENSMTIRVPGTGFLNKDDHKTIGNKIRVLFAANKPKGDGEIKIDVPKSGDYVIYAAKHTFKAERYDIHMTGGKLLNFETDVWPS